MFYFTFKPCFRNLPFRNIPQHDLDSTLRYCLCQSLYFFSLSPFLILNDLFHTIHQSFPPLLVLWHLTYTRCWANHTSSFHVSWWNCAQIKYKQKINQRITTGALAVDDGPYRKWEQMTKLWSEKLQREYFNPTLLHTQLNSTTERAGNADPDVRPTQTHNSSRSRFFPSKSTQPHNLID